MNTVIGQLREATRSASKWASHRRRWLLPVVACVAAVVPLTTLITQTLSSQPPSAAPAANNGLFMFASNTSEGAMLGWAIVDEPIAVNSDRPIEVRFTVASTITAGVSVLIGGDAALAEPSCYGDGWDLATLPASKLSEAQANGVRDYLLVAPMTGAVEYHEESRTASREAVDNEISELKFVVAVPTVWSEPGQRTIRLDDDERTYSSVRNATLTCAFEPAVFWQGWGDDEVFTFPDLIVARGVFDGSAGEEAYVYADRRVTFAPDPDFAMNFSSVVPTTSNADALAFADQWAAWDYPTRRAVAVSELRAAFTSASVDDFRQVRFVAIGFLASILIALIPAIIDTVTSRPRMKVSAQDDQ